MIPEPKTKGNPPVKAKFFKDGNKDIIEVAVIGDPNIYHGKVTPQDIARFPKEWEAYQAGLDLPQPEGLDLMEIPGMTQQLAQWYKLHGVAVVEQLAEASDIAIQKLGMGSATFRKHAQNLLKAKAFEAQAAMAAAAVKEPKSHAAAADEPRKPGRPKKQEADSE